MRLEGFVGPSYTLQTVNYDCQRCINLYPEVDESGFGKEKEVMALLWTPGLSLLAALGDGPIRGQYRASNGTYYVASGDKIYRVSSDFTSTEIGSLNTETGRVNFADNGTTLMFVDGEDAYQSTLGSSTISMLVDPAFGSATHITFLNSRFIVNSLGTGRFYWSDLLSTTFDPLSFATAEGSPDNLVALISDKQNLWLWGPDSIEVWYDTGDAINTFARQQGAYIEYGTDAPNSPCLLKNTFFWLSRDENGNGMVYAAEGFQPRRISTHAVEFAIQGYANIEDAETWTYQQAGHYFFVLNFPTADTTWVFDTATNLWHERVYTQMGSFERHRANSHAFVFNKHIVGDYENGNLYELSQSVYTDNGNPITRQRVTPHLTAGLKEVFYSSFQLDAEMGVGADGGVQGENPQAMLQWSDDGGHSWSNELWRSFGRIGKRNHRAIWRRLGKSRDRVFKLTITDPVKVAIIGAQFEAEAGVS